MKRAITLAAFTLTSALALSACGNGTESDNADSATTTATTATTAEDITATAATTEETAVVSTEEISAEHNDADIMFAQMMLPHHEQAVEMSEMLLAKDNIPTEVADFAQGVIDAQGPEIERMNAMLSAWGAEPEGMEGMDHDGMSGMMSEEDLAALDDAEGTEAVRLYLEQMTAHHEGAVEMARDEVENGQNPQAVVLSEQVIEDQETEIAEMEQMLQNL